ncbi:MAG: patatin-like phospholipase family protein [Acidimicrobiia bacterium]|nr:patatin-like phospholipase family protein [Acidimicrobiia bacterium]
MSATNPPPPDETDLTALSDEVTYASITRALRATDLFDVLSDDDLEKLSMIVESIQIPGGHTLVQEGDPADGLYIVVTGRLRARVKDPDGYQVVVGEIGAQEVVGEMAVIGSSARSATVEAVRDSHLLRLGREDFHTLAMEHPAILLGMSKTLVGRLERSIHNTSRPHNHRVIALMPAGSESDDGGFARQLAEGIRKYRTVTVVDRAKAFEDCNVDVDSHNISPYLYELELKHDVVLLVADTSDEAWLKRCIRTADLVLLVGRVSRLDGLGPAEMLLDDIARAREGSRTHHSHLAIRHATPHGASGTAEILRMRSIDRHHHVASQADIERLARIVVGSSHGLVLSGGGAKGMAHIGVIRALREADIPIDHIAGVSIGSSVAAGHALGWNSRQMVEQGRRLTLDHGSLLDLTLPLLAMASGRRLRASISDGYGKLDIEDLWIEYFCVSSDLNAGRARIHTSGSLANAMRASVAIPGAFPPVKAADGHVLVDGAMTDNFPLDAMRTVFSPSVVIGSDLKTGFSVPTDDLPSDGIVSGFGIAARRFVPGRRAAQIPRMIDILMRSSEISNSERHTQADLLIKPPVEAFGALDFPRYLEIIEAGYQGARAAIESWDRIRS